MNEKKAVLNESVLQRFCKIDVGIIQKIVQQSGGLVHYVYIVEGDCDSVCIKIRKGTFASISSLKIDADDIVYEKMGLQLMGKLCPNTFPKLLHYSSVYNFLILENIFKNGGLTLKEYFDLGHIKAKIFQNIGFTINQTLSIVKQFEIDEAHIFPEKRFEENLKYRIGFISNKQAANLINELIEDDKQIILGDIAPKNIGLLPDGKIKLFDLDLIAIGSKAFDLGYLAGHLILEGYRYGQAATRDILGNFFSGYKQYSDDGLIENMKTVKVALATLIYRLNSGLIPYPIDIPSFRKEDLLANAHDLFNSNEVCWHKLLFF